MKLSPLMLIRVMLALSQLKSCNIKKEKKLMNSHFSSSKNWFLTQSRFLHVFLDILLNQREKNTYCTRGSLKTPTSNIFNSRMCWNYFQMRIFYICFQFNKIFLASSCYHCMNILFCTFFLDKIALSQTISTHCVQLVQPDKSCGKPKQASLAHIPRPNYWKILILRDLTTTCRLLEPLIISFATSYLLLVLD